MIFILKYWKFIVAVLAVLSLVGAFFGYGATKHREGYNACVADYTAAQVKADEKARQKQAEIGKKSLEVEDEVRNTKGANAPASSYLRSVLDRLRN